MTTVFPTAVDIAAIEAQMDQCQSAINTARQFARTHGLTSEFEAALTLRQKDLDTQRARLQSVK